MILGFMVTGWGIAVVSASDTRFQSPLANLECPTGHYHYLSVQSGPRLLGQEHQSNL